MAAPRLLPRRPGFTIPLLCLVSFALASVSASTSTSRPAVSTSVELSEDREFIYEDFLDQRSVICPRPMCECKHAGSGGIVAKCSSLDFKGQRFQGVVNHLEVSDAPEFADGLFLLNNSLASLGLQFLTTVKVSNASIKGLSVFTFDGLKELYDVDLSNNHIMIPHQDVFLNNKQLRKLSLRGNPIGVAQVVENTMEKSHLLNSASLNELDLSGCGLEILSPHVFSRMKHLERLLLAANHLKMLHNDTLSALAELEELNLSSNFIREIFTVMFVNNTELTELYLRNNSLHSLRGVEIPGLDVLDVAENWFEAIENDTFQGFPALTGLNLSSNAIRSIHPRAFETLRYLQDLDLSANEIEGPLPRGLFASCEVLETLNLSDNPNMGSLPKGGFQGLFSALYQLDLSYTGLRRLDNDSFLGMDHLSVLNLEGNKLTKLGAGVLQRLPQLITLDLSDNAISALDSKVLQTNGFLRNLDLSGNPLTVVSPHVFVGTPYLRWLDLSRCLLTSLWEGGQGAEATPLRKLGHLNVANNRIASLPTAKLSLASGLTVLDISGNPLKCNKELHSLMEWLVKRSVAPRSSSAMSAGGALQNDLLHDVQDMVEARSLRARWAGVYDALCGDRASAAPARGITQEELDDIEMVLGKKKLAVPSADENEDDADDDDSYSDADDSALSNSNVEEADDEDDDEDDDDGGEGDDEYDDTNLIADANSSGTGYFSFTRRGSPYLWPLLTISAVVVTAVLVVCNLVVCLVRRRRARRHARFQSPMFRQLGGLSTSGHHKTFGGIPGSFIKTKKDGGFVYRKLYEDTTTPVLVPQPPQARTFRFPLDPSDLQGSNDPQRV